MKVQIYAGALVAACDRAIPKLEQAKSELIPKPKPWWDFSGSQPNLELREINLRLTRAKLFRAIAIHKQPQTLLEITDPELEGIAPYLAEFEGGRI